MSDTDFAVGLLTGITRSFIDVLPVDLVLWPVTRVSDGAGGHKTQRATIPRDPQRMTLVEASGPSDPVPGDTGVNVQTRHEIVAMPDAVMAVGDEFDLDAKTWTVDTLFHFNGYERRASVTSHG